MFDFSEINLNSSDIDIDGDGIADFTAVDSNGDGVFDSIIHQVDTDGDGYVDTIMQYNDYNNDGVIDDVAMISDTDHDGYFDVTCHGYDTNGDGFIDTFDSVDYNSDENNEMTGHFIDSDNDGAPDAYLNLVDTDGDSIIDSVEIYDIDENTGDFNYLGTEDLFDDGTDNFSYDDSDNYSDESDYFEPVNIDYDEPVPGLFAEDLENFDPSNADPHDITGNPDESMAEWEFQGNTNRCALYSQKFIIDEFTGEDIDIEEFADIAEENGWFSEEGGTPLLDMNKMLEYYGVENELSFNNDINDLKDCLESGGKAIVSIDADEIWYGETDDLYTPDDGPNHAVQVIGIDESDPDEPMVILNDSGNPNGCGVMIPMENFIDAWEDGNYQMVECYA